MSDIFERTELLIGQENLAKLKNSCVAVFGLGGVGSFAAEAICRAGVGKLLIVDNDEINLSNINRQLFALHSTVGKQKTEVAKDRLKDINPEVEIIDYPIYFDETTLEKFDFSDVDYFVDCIDSVKSKIILCQTAKRLEKPIICCLGTGNKLDNTKFKVTDIYSTSGCPLAKKMRCELKKVGIEKLKVVFSEELPHEKVSQRVIPSISFVPPVAGMIIAGEVVKDLINR